MNSWRYRYHGLSVDSEICLPEWSAFEIPRDSPDFSSHDVTIRREEPGIEATAPAAGEYRFSIGQTGEFIVRDGREIRFTPVPEIAALGEGDSASKKIRPFLLGSAWGALLYQRGQLVLHASGVQVNGGAVAFCARRGGGKSTMAAMLSALGHPLLSDDLCCISSVGSTRQVHPSVPRFRLCEDAVASLGWSAAHGHRDHMPSGKYHYYPTDRQIAKPLRLLRIYLLSWGTPEIHRVRGFNALTRLTSAGTWRGDILIAAGNPVEHFSQYAQLLREVECWEFRRPRDLSALEDSAVQMSKHLSGIGVP